ncbi:MAG: glycoside hydrolase family 104 protein [Methylobacter sp.]
MKSNRQAFLHMIAVSELGQKLIDVSDNGYNVIVGSTPDNPILFWSYIDHPRRKIDLPKLKIKSTAAGRYQILARYYDAYKTQLGLPDFGPESQDLIALQMIRECKALADVDAGRFAEAVRKCRSRWASLTGSPYKQHTNSIEFLTKAYIDGGGTLEA